MTVRELAARLRERLAAAVDGPALEAELLVAAALGCERSELWRRDADAAPAAVVAAAAAWCERRAQQEPLAYLLGTKEFFGRRFRIDPGVLIPRPETELLVDAALLRGARGIWLDVGTGSGVLAVTLALESPHLRRVVATDLSPQAVACARANAAALRAADRVQVVHADALEAWLPVPCFNGIVSNPPYIPAADHARLDPAVQRFEPRLALVPPRGGPTSFRAELIAGARERLRPGGHLLIEVGAGQAGIARGQLLAAGFRGVSIVNDLAGIGRVVAGALPATGSGERGPPATGP